MRSRDIPAMPKSVTVLGTVRDFGSAELVVGRLVFVDVEDQSLELDVTPETAMDLMVQLAKFLQGVGVEGTNG